MIGELLRFSRATPLSIGILGAHFLVYSAVAWLVLAGRLVSFRMKRGELVLLLVWIVTLGIEFVQVWVTRGSLISPKTDTWGLARYFGVFAPMLWMWDAWLLAKLWDVHHAFERFPKVCGVVKWTCRALALGTVVTMFAAFGFRETKAVYARNVREDVSSAARRAARVIQRDYAGPKRQAKVLRNASDYFIAARPVVFSDFGYLAWLLRTSSEGAITGSNCSPYPADYLFFRTMTGYGGKKSVDAGKYDLLTKIRSSIGCEWQLYRRKGVPHR